MPDPSPDQLRVRLVQRASGLEPADNLAALEEVAALPGERDLVILPEAFARDFGEPGSDLAPYAEPLDGPFVDRLRQLSENTGAGSWPSVPKRWTMADAISCWFARMADSASASKRFGSSVLTVSR